MYKKKEERKVFPSTQFWRMMLLHTAFLPGGVLELWVCDSRASGLCSSFLLASYRFPPTGPQKKSHFSPAAFKIVGNLIIMCLRVSFGLPFLGGPSAFMVLGLHLYLGKFIQYFFKLAFCSLFSFFSLAFLWLTYLYSWWCFIIPYAFFIPFSLFLL